MKTPLCEQLGIEFPIFAFSHCRDVVASVSKMGGMGVLGAVALSAEELEQELQCLDRETEGRPYGVDTVIPASYVGKSSGDLSKQDLAAMVPEVHQTFIAGLLARYGVPELPETVKTTESLLGWTVSSGLAHVDVALAHERCKLIANALGPPPKSMIDKAHAQGVMVAALCGTVPQALKQKEAGVDIIVASGYEAGGHTGEIGSLVLTPQVVDAVAPIPVLAAGGIGCGRQMAAAMVLGAQGVWTGSIWLTTFDSECLPPLVDKLLAATSTDTVRSRCISGKPARQLVTDYTRAWDEMPQGTLKMPLQWMATAETTQRIHRHAARGGGAELLGTPVGQVVGQMNARASVPTVIGELVDEYLEAVEWVARLSDLLPAAETTLG